MDTFMLFVLAIIISAAVVAWGYRTIRHEKFVRNQNEVAQCREMLVKAIRKSGTNGFQIDQFCESYQFDRRIAQQASQVVYRQAFSAALRDNGYSNPEMSQLKLLAIAMGLNSDDCQKIENLVRESKYAQELDSRLSNGKITDVEAKELDQLRLSLGLAKKQVRSAVGQTAHQAYVNLFRDVIEDWVITPEELRELKQLRVATGLSKTEANQLIRNDAMKVFREWFTNAIQDGEVTPEEIQSLVWLRDEFDLGDSFTDPFLKRIHRVNRLAEYRKGNLMGIKCTRLLEGGEICYWDKPCEYTWKTQTARKSASGELIVTSNQIIFISEFKSFKYSPSRVVDMHLYSDAIDIQTSMSKGAGSYYTDDAEMLEAIIEGIVRKHKYNTGTKFQSFYSRHIPDTVRREVYSRDGGRCVRCNADDYLEFDHIIPFSKGGANTTNNVQLLCRRCNLSKSDRI